ncbi:phage head-tail connector protein [Tuberibacillus calidus]|jgi:hypothetical protein|uniref:phage head-tail connector protein n=1 Tax=Tuberibacillus calidus TaxID=340097 RepID=UPI0003FED641|nr:phage head-tail connector protein [Tuberibacillus calidus]
MITVDRVKQELNIPKEDTSKDDQIKSTIDDMVSWIQEYTRNPKLFVDIEKRALDDCLLYLTLERLSPCTKHANRGGKTGESVGGYTVNYMDGLPFEIRVILNQFTKRISYV